MTEQTKQAAPSPQSQPSINNKAAPTEGVKSGSKQKSGKKSLAGLLFSLLLAVGLGGLAYFFMEQQKAIDVLFTQQNQFVQQGLINASAFSTAQTELQTLQQEVTSSSALISEQKLELERLNRELISARLKINASGGGGSQAWLLEETESLLRIAQQRLIVSHDVRSALALFVTSDDILKQINDPAIFTIRNILASDMAALRAVVEIDVQGIYLQLGVLAQNISALKIVSGSAEQLAASEKISLGNNASNDEAGFFDAVLGKLGEYVVVRRSDEPIQPLLTPEQEFYIKQNIQLQLEQARLALLREQEEVYRNSIAAALENITLYLVEDGRKKQSLIESLRLLHDAQIIVQIPPVTNTLTALQQILPEAAQQ